MYTLIVREAELFAKAKAAMRVFALLLACAACFACQSAPDDLALSADQVGVIFVRTKDSGTLDNNFIGNDDADLILLQPISPNGKLTNLTEAYTKANGSAVDPEISYDGRKVIFSMRQSGANNFDIYEMNVVGSNLRRVTNTPYDEADPAYLPNGKIVYTCNRRNIRDEYERREVENLHTMDANGGNVQGISFNNSDDFDPIVMRDGRVVWTRWEHHGTQNRFPLFFTKPDGQSTFLFFGTHNNGMTRNFFHPRELPDGKVVAVMSDQVLVDRGPLVVLNSDQTTGDPAQSTDFTNITPAVPMGGGNQPGVGSFKYPFPLPDGRLLASYSPNGMDGDYGLYTLNRNGSGLALLYSNPNEHELDAVVVAPREKPPVIPETIDKTATTGVFVNQNVYFRQKRSDGRSLDGQAIPAPGEIDSVMVIEGIGATQNDRSEFTSFERKRVLGVAPVYADGSFAIRVPINIPISFNTLDSLGRAVVIKRSWLYARPGENFNNCTGCHGPRGVKSNPNPMAASLEPTDLNVAQAQREVIAFSNAIAPIIQRKCVSCHSGVSPAAALDLSLAQAGEYTAAYRNLMSTMRNNLRLVEVDNPPFARRSRLIDVLLGVGTRQGAGAHPDSTRALTAAEKRKFITWVDLGGQYE